MSKRTKWIIVLLVIIGLIIGMSIYHEVGKTKPAPQIPPTVVDASTSQAQNWNLRIPATGILEGSPGVTLQSTVTQGGVVTGIFFRSGQYVKVGQPLFQINPGDNRTIIAAPFSGRVGLKLVELGSYVMQGTKLVTIQSYTPIKVDFTIPQSYLANVAIGDTALVNVSTYPGQSFTAQVYAINASLDPDSRTIEMWASLPNQAQKLLPGMFVEVTLIVAQQVPVVVVPKSAVVHSDAGDYVFVLNNGIAHKTDVVVAMTVDNQVGLSKGLKGNEQVASSNAMALDDGWPVIVTGTPQYQQYEAAQAKTSTVGPS